MRLPPPGSDSDTIARYIDRLVEESARDPNREAWLEECESNLNMYLGKQWSHAAAAGIDRVTLNRVQNCVISMVAGQAADPPKITFAPQETGEPPIYYFNADAKDAERVRMALGQTFTVTDPISPELVDQINNLIEMSYLEAKISPGMKPISNDVVIEVTDQSTAQTVQTVFDAQWEESGLQLDYTENNINKNVFGFQPSLYEFDDETKRHLLRNTLPKQVFVDPLQTDSTKWHYAVYDEAVSEEEAIARWPQLREKLEGQGDEGSIVRPGGASYDQSAAYNENSFSRHMISVRTAWVRYQPYPIDPDKALEMEKVKSEAIATDEMETVTDETGAVISQTPKTRMAFFSGTGEEIDENHPEWPTRMGIRQITIVKGNVVQDKECETADIPLPTNRNIPIPNSPYGQGEPKRLETLQTAINRLLTSYVTWHRYACFPPEFMPKSVAESLGDSLKNARTKPGQRVLIPDDIFQRFKGIDGIIQYAQTANMPPEFWQMLNLLIGLIDKEGNQADVAEGNAAAGWSGEAINSLQNAHNTIVQGKSIFTEHYLKQIAKLMVHSITTRMSVDDWKKYVSKPIYALTALYQRNKTLEKDISVQIRSGSGASRQAQTNNLIAAKQAGLSISEPELLERMDVDPDTQLQRTMEWEKKKARSMQAAPMGAQAANTAAGQPNGGPPQADQTQLTGAAQ